METGTFRSFIMGGFECSTHRLPTGKRLDLLRSTRHDELAASDYRLLQRHGILTARDGLRWHLIEQTAGRYDFSSANAMLQAARDTGMQVIWDLWHYGWPDDIDIFSGAFVDRFAAYASEAIKRIGDFDEAPLISPINEISFFSWAGGEGGHLQPVRETSRRRDEAAAGAHRPSARSIAMREMRIAAVRIVQIDPIINVVPEKRAGRRPTECRGIPAKPVRSLGHDHSGERSRNSADVTISSTSSA